MARKASDEHQFLLTTLPPSHRQRVLALGIIVLLFIAFGVAAPFANTHLQLLNSFIPTIDGIYLINDFVISVLLLPQYLITRRWALLVLANGFFFAALIVIPHALTFPEAFAATGLLGAGLQSAGWLYIFWNFGLLLAVIFYALLKDMDGQTSTSGRPPEVVILWSVLVVVAIVSGLTWIATAEERFLPSLFLDNVYFYDNFHPVHGVLTLIGVLLVSLCGVAFLLLLAHLELCAEVGDGVKG
jgi:hypothetical protein